MIRVASWTVLAFVAIAVSGVRLAAQGTQSDYARARQLRPLAENKVFKSRVRPNWFAENTKFWYRNDLAGGQREFVLVDAAAGKREPAFDHARLAEAMSKQLREPVDARRLPVERLRFDEKEPAALLFGRGKTWRFDLRDYTLREEKADDDAGDRLRPLDSPARSQRTGSETWISFENKTGAKVDLFWVDPQGQRKPYGNLGPGEERRQHTFAGHVWSAVDGQGRQIAAFEAVEDGGEAIIDSRPAPKAEPEKARRPRRPSSNDSPDGKWSAFFRDNNLYVRDRASGEETALSADGTPDDAYSGRVYWSPDSERLIALKTAKGDDRKVYYIESSPKDQVQPKLHSYDYLKPGDKIPQSKPHLFDVGPRKEIPIGDGLSANPWSIGEVRWASDSQRFTFLYNQRGHQVLRVVAVDAATGKSQAIVDEQSPTFINYSGKFFCHYLDETDEILWMSERDGWNHLYLYDAKTGKLKNQVTHGPWVVRGVDRVDSEKREVWFRAGGIRPEQDPYYVHYARVRLDGTGLVVLTAGDGTHSIEFSPDRRVLIDTWSRVDHPPVAELRRADDGRLLCTLEQADWSELLKTGWQVPERFAAKGRDGATDIFGVIYRPTTFDSNRKYPVIEAIYAGPQGSFVPKEFRSFHGPQAMAELGFIVLQIDGMGTSNRSKAFHDVCWKNLADSGFPDRVLWMRAAAKTRPFMDLGRVGIYGGSAGGQSAVRALIAHSDFYRVAVADCGCHDNRMDKIWWNEQWMGWPIGPHYAEQSNAAQAHRLQGKLLLVVGEMDENVDPASTMQVVSALVKADKDFDLLVIPGAGHGAAETPYGSRRRQDFLVRHLLGVEPRSRP